MVQEHEKKFLEFLSLSSSYDYDPEFVEVVQTHISIVAIAPPYVFKIKKNIKLDFLDYSSLEKRKFYLEKEIELNRRLCGNVYIEIVPIYEFEGLLSFEKFFHGSGRIYDYALKMNYLKPEFCLVNILKNNSLSDQHMEFLIEKLGKFYFSQKPTKKCLEIIRDANPDAVLKMFQTNLNELKKVANAILPAHTLDVLENFLELFFKRHIHELKNRYSPEFIKDGHGDLRLEHIYIQDKNISIYDCIEFNDSFRHIDILNDIAFLLMELDFNHYNIISLKFRDKFLRYFKSYNEESVLAFYKIHRALVRAKVNCIVSKEDEIPHEKRKLAVKNAEKFLSLAVKYSLTLDRPTIFIVMGKTASGKSTVAKKISHDSGLQILSTDVIRKNLAKVDLHTETPDELKSKIYSPEFTETVYNEILSSAEKMLQENNGIILDATFSKKKYRRLVLEKFSKIQTFFIEVNSSETEKIKRLKHRQQTGSISDARITDKQKIDDLYEVPDEIPESMKIILNNSTEIDNVINQLYNSIYTLIN
ncbi:MAG: AAA family ATPase [Spirochaetia bacterium]|nr:AAA family ATPase [Spirochaetia bacterium]